MPPRCVRAPGDDVQGTAGNRVVSGTFELVQAYFYLLGQAAHAFHGLDRALGTDFLGVAVDVPGEGHHAVLHRHTDAGCIDIGFEFQLFEHKVSQVKVVHDRLR